MRYQRNTCPADLATAGHESVAAAGHCGSVVVSSGRHHHRRCELAKLSASPSADTSDAPLFNAPVVLNAPVFDAPALTEETLLDVSLCCLLTLFNNVHMCFSYSEKL